VGQAQVAPELHGKFEVPGGPWEPAAVAALPDKAAVDPGQSEPADYL
jgi:hypothetical protein